VCSLQRTAKDSHTFNAVKSGVEEFGGFEKLSFVVTDGARALLGSTNRSVGL
jgi:hypothetical protein